MYYLIRDGDLVREFETEEETISALESRYAPGLSVEEAIDLEGWEILDEDDFQERLTQWADKEGININDITTDENGDEYVLVEGEEGYEKLYVDYTKLD